MAEGDAGARATAQAFRKMQLEGSVFAVAVIQLKPQLERLLNLPDDRWADQTFSSSRCVAAGC